MAISLRSAIDSARTRSLTPVLEEREAQVIESINRKILADAAAAGTPFPVRTDPTGVVPIGGITQIVPTSPSGPTGPTPILPPPSGPSSMATAFPGTSFGPAPTGTGITGVNIGPGGISVGGSIGGVPISATIPIGGGGGSEPPQGSPTVPGSALAAPVTGNCPGPFSVPGPNGTCIDLTALPPGGDPALTGQMGGMAAPDGFGAAVKGFFGVGILPRVEVQRVRRCPPGTALGKDGVCYEGLGRNSKKRAWPMGMKPLLTAGDRAAIRKASRAAAALNRSKKTLKKASRALEKAGC